MQAGKGKQSFDLLHESYNGEARDFPHTKQTLLKGKLIYHRWKLILTIFGLFLLEVARQTHEHPTFYGQAAHLKILWWSLNSMARVKVRIDPGMRPAAQ